MNEDEKKKIIYKEPPSRNASLEEWKAFRPYSFMTAIMTMERIYTLSKEFKKGQKNSKDKRI
jgi:hypothetical protein